MVMEGEWQAPWDKMPPIPDGPASTWNFKLNHWKDQALATLLNYLKTHPELATVQAIPRFPPPLYE